MSEENKVTMETGNSGTKGGGEALEGDPVAGVMALFSTIQQTFQEDMETREV